MNSLSSRRGNESGKAPIEGSGLRVGNAARNNLAPVLDDFPIPVTSPLGIRRSSTPFPMLRWVLRPEMIIRVNQDTFYCAALRAHEGARPRLAAPRRDIGHLLHPLPPHLLQGLTILLPFEPESSSHSKRIDEPDGFSV
jgi:hypothetical protein